MGRCRVWGKGWGAGGTGMPDIQVAQGPFMALYGPASTSKEFLGFVVLHFF